ncbi:MAG TPA: Xaa-Pro peptidase family protein [Opitutaceae bacterium]|nr:Xaa-Pro peptidase family protein [Opitutaceae bacterium]
MPKNSSPRLIYAASESSADMLYATRFFVPDPFFYLEQNGKKSILLSDLEIDRGRREAKVDEVISLSLIQRPLEKRLKKKPTIEQTIERFLRQRRVRRAVVPSDFPLGLAHALDASGIKLEPISGLFDPGREFKRDEEIKQLQQAIALTEVGLERAYAVLRASEIKPGRKLFWGGKRLTSELLRAEIECAILRAGGIPLNTIVAGGDQACDPHERGSGPLAANSLIILDVFPRAAETGYYGDITRTVLRGKASEAQKRLWHTVLEGQAYALKKIRPGLSGQQLQKEVSDLFTNGGFPTEVREGRWTGFFHGLGHALGLEIHESPRIAATKFKNGQVFTVEPGLYLPNVGGVRHEDDGVVTGDGFRVLSKFPKVLEL